CDDCFALIEIFRDISCEKFFYIDGLHYATAYNDKLVKSIIHSCKYARIKELTRPLADLIIAHFKLLDNQTMLSTQLFSKEQNSSNLIVCCVPIHKKKLKNREFNQSEEIAKHLSEEFGLNFIKDLIIKIKNTPPQAELSKDERKKNITNTFEINPLLKDVIKDKNILLVDDVFTTGSTMEECSKILKQNCAQSVWGAVVARD
ncbi:MAG: phosphoribosyltransferase family protein, partial [Candidatus Parcubacteria bacterium]|nr:phosphoribosyltransferase family protein [Candidatus Parcubacteria bacterium]